MGPLALLALAGGMGGLASIMKQKGVDLKKKKKDITGMGDKGGGGGKKGGGKKSGGQTGGPGNPNTGTGSGSGDVVL